MAQSMHGGYNKNDNPALKALKGDRSKILVGNWSEERALLEVKTPSAAPQSKRLTDAMRKSV